MANWSGTPAVLHYAACVKGIEELERLASGLGLASSDERIRHLVPRMLAHENLENGAAVLVQSRIPAEPYQFSWRRIDAAMELWLSRKPRREFGGRAQVSERLAQLCAFLPHYEESLIPVTDALLEWCGTTRIPGDITHGDFWLGNVLFSGGNVTGIIDWEWGQKDGFVLVDALHMLLMSPADANGDRVVNYLRQLWADEIGDAALQERIVRLRSQFGIDKDDLKFIALLLWFSIIWQKAMRGRVASSQWLEDMIPRSIPAVMKWLTRISRPRGPLPLKRNLK